MKILILGGYGTFGGRLAHLLADRADLTLVIAGRNEAAARAFCDRYPGPAAVQPMAMDRAEIAACLADVAPDVVVDASGPFQTYGGDPYGVPRACIAAGVQYLDFSDAADFTAGISALDQEAKAAGVCVLSGVSSFPVLTAAVLRVMAQKMTITSVTGGIAPSPFAGMGLNVMRAVVGYAGEDLTLFRDGVWSKGKGLAETRRFTVAPPGLMPLPHLKFALVDVPDLQVIPPEHPGIRALWMGAAPSPGVLLSALVILARLRARLPLPSLVPLARVFQVVLGLTARSVGGEHRGGMFVQAEGMQDGRAVTRSWHLLAEGDDGPFIPSMAIEILLRRMADGVQSAAGARPATRALELRDYEQVFARRHIEFGWREDSGTIGRLYPDILGAAYEDLPEQVRALHWPEATVGRTVWHGQAQIEGADNVIGRMIARLFRFPSAARDVPTSVTFDTNGAQEVWTRRFGTQKMVSTQEPGRGRNAHLMVERFGPVAVALAVTVVERRLYLTPRRWTVFGVPLPKFLLPGGQTFEAEENGKFQFDVTISVPIVGRLVRYCGWLEPQTTSAASVL